MLRGQNEITFLDAIFFSEGTAARVSAETRNLEDGGLIDRFYAVRRDEKNRKQTTYGKLGVTKDEIRAGMPPEEFEASVFDYFTRHSGPAAGLDAKNISALLKRAGNPVLDMHSLSLYCQEPVGDGSPEDLRETFDACIRVCARLERAKKNRIECILKSVRYWTQSCSQGTRSFLKKFLFFYTSAGAVYYDIGREKWGMSRKEQERTGFRIEYFDTENILDQAFRKYRVGSVKELEMKIRAGMRCA